MLNIPFLFVAQAPAPPAAPSSMTFFIQVGCMLVIAYFLIIRPQQKKAKDLQTLISSLKTGDKVVTRGGIHGIVANVKDGSTLSLKIADNVKIEVDKSAIESVDRPSSSSGSEASPKA